MNQEYRIIKAISSEELSAFVNSHLNADLEAGKTGWRLVGGPVYMGHMPIHMRCWAQAMHRETTLGF